MWRIHNVFHASQLKPAVGFVPGAAFDTLFRPGANSSGEFEVEDILDHRSMRTGYKYLAKQRGYPVVKVIWEPVSNLEHCPDVLRVYSEHRGLRSSRRGE